MVELPYKRNYLEAGLRDTLTVDQLIDIAIADREQYDDREDMGGAALQEYYEALPALTFKKQANKLASYEALPSYGFGINQKVLKRFCNNDCHVWHKNAESGMNYHGDDVASHYDNMTDINYGCYDQLCQFDSFPVGGTVASAYLYIYLIGTTPLSSYSARRITTSWGETAVTYNSIKDYYSAVRDAGSVGGVGWQTIDVTNILKDWVESGISQYGICLSGHDVPAADPLIEWYNRHQFAGAYNCYIIATINY